MNSQKNSQMSKVEIKKVTENEMEEIERVDAEMWKDVWPDVWWDPKDQYLPRLKTFPEGFFGAYENGGLIGFTTSQIINYDPSKPLMKSWNEITDNGHIRNTHNLDGNSLYVVSLGVSIHHRGKGTGGLLIERQKELAKEKGLQYLVLGARMPGFKEHCEKNSITNPDTKIAELYAQKRNEKGEPIDPEIRFYERHGLKFVNATPNYEGDTASLNFGAVMVWENR